MTDEGSISAGWVLAGVTSIIATLSTLVAFLYKKLDANNSRTIASLEARCDVLQKRSDDCERDRIELHKMSAKHEVEIAMLKDRTKGISRSHE